MTEGYSVIPPAEESKTGMLEVSPFKQEEKKQQR